MRLLEQLQIKRLEKQIVLPLKTIASSKMYGKIVQIGAGTGYILDVYPFSQLQQITIVDNKISSFAMSAIYKHPSRERIRPKATRIEELPIKDESIDFALLLPFYKLVNLGKSVDEIIRVLNSNGVLWIVLPKIDFGRSPLLLNVTLFPRDEFFSTFLNKKLILEFEESINERWMLQAYKKSI